MSDEQHCIPPNTVADQYRSAIANELEELARLGRVDATLELAHRYRKGIRGLPQDFLQAKQWYYKAVDQGSATARYNIGEMHFLGLGDPESMLGTGRRGSDTAAAHWYREAAEQGHVEAQHRLGTMYFMGWGVPKDGAEAAKWYLKAAEQGHATAQHRVGLFYQWGHGLPENEAEGVRWYRRAAEQGHVEAQESLGLSYVCGWGVPVDYVQAYMWFTLAAAQGDESAAGSLNILTEEMTPAQIAESQKLAQEWQPAHQ